jgi:hypothetical protein
LFEKTDNNKKKVDKKNEKNKKKQYIDIEVNPNKIKN